MEAAEEVRVRGAYMKRTRTVRSPRMTLRRHGHGGGLGARGAARRWWCLGAGEEALQIAHIQQEIFFVIIYRIFLNIKKRPIKCVSGGAECE